MSASKEFFNAAETGNVAYITRVVDRSIEFDINQKDNLDRTALHWAAEMGHVTTAEALLDYGINVFSTECNGRTAVHLAARSANADMLRTILGSMSQPDREKLINVADNFGITAVFLAKQKGAEGQAAFEVLMSYGGRFSELSAPKAVSAAHATPAAARA